MASSYLPKATRNNYRSVTAYLPKSDWNLAALLTLLLPDLKATISFLDGGLDKKSKFIYNI